MTVGVRTNRSRQARKESQKFSSRVASACLATTLISARVTEQTACERTTVECNKHRSNFLLTSTHASEHQWITLKRNGPTFPPGVYIHVRWIVFRGQRHLRRRFVAKNIIGLFVLVFVDVRQLIRHYSASAKVTKRLNKGDQQMCLAYVRARRRVRWIFFFFFSLLKIQFTRQQYYCVDSREQNMIAVLFLSFFLLSLSVSLYPHAFL